MGLRDDPPAHGALLLRPGTSVDENQILRLPIARHQSSVPRLSIEVDLQICKGMPGKTYSAFGGTGSPLHFDVPELGAMYGASLDAVNVDGWSTMWGRPKNVPVGM
jgi:hypothetical protein